MGFISGVATHMARLLALRHDGSGLPKVPGGGLAFCIGLAILVAGLRYGVGLSMAPEPVEPHWLAFLIGLGLFFALVRLFLGIPGLCAYALISAAMDITIIPAYLMGIPSLPFTLWECTALVVIAMRLHSQSQNHKT